MQRLLFKVLPCAFTAAVTGDLTEAAGPTCPPKDFSTVKGFDLKAFASARWYAQQQMAVSYLPESQNRCVYAEYTIKEKASFWGYDVGVRNYAEDVAPPHGAHDSGSFLCAKVVDQDAGKLEVAPCFLPTFAAGPYWVVAYSEGEGYALVSGGAPDRSAEGGCRTGTGTNNAGLWIFTRQQAREEALVQKVRAIAAVKGFDVSVLNDVDQSGCSSQPVVLASSATENPEAGALALTCPPKDFSTVKGFDLKAFASARWYAQQQMAVVYLPESQNRCVYAEYTIKEKASFWGYDVGVHNYAEDVAEPHTAQDSKSFLCAKVVDQDAGKLEVAPCFLPTFAAGPYWVVAYSEGEGYALVSGGAPDRSAEGGCRTGTGVNNAGLWIFTRRQARDEALVQKVRGIAAGKGFDVSVLNDVDQSDCSSPRLGGILYN